MMEPLHNVHPEAPVTPIVEPLDDIESQDSIPYHQLDLPPLPGHGLLGKRIGCLRDAATRNLLSDLLMIGDLVNVFFVIVCDIIGFPIWPSSYVSPGRPCTNGDGCSDAGACPAPNTSVRTVQGEGAIDFFFFF